MKLNGRLAAIYEMIPQCAVLGDIGTDHGLIPAAAVLDGRCVRAVAADVGKGPLDRARQTVERFRLSDRVDLRLGDGLAPFGENECDVIVLAGMGGLLITGILGASPDKAAFARCILIQAMHAQDAVRPWLRENGYEIVDERLAADSGKLYEILSVHRNGRPDPSEEQVHDGGSARGKVSAERPETEANEAHAAGAPQSDRQFAPDADDPLRDVVGRLLLKKRDPLLPEWVDEKWRKQLRIVEGMRRSVREHGELPAAEARLLALERLRSQLRPAGGKAGNNDLS